MPVVLDLTQCEITYPAVRPLAIVVRLDVVEDFFLHLAQGRPGVQIDKLFLDGGVERFREGISVSWRELEMF
jgi:hypothetical protein